ncbi:MAG: SgcJ/EcaC family oxidoreductase [Longimicrobiales bacterium]|nr:SgcJ/EcaC family oxidoreductase [Longimicrobiales bacterium]
MTTSGAVRRTLFILPLALIGCGEGRAAEDTTGASAALDAMRSTVLEAVLGKDASAIASLYADDAVVHDFNGQLLTGRTAIEARVAAVLPRVEAYSLTSHRFEGSGDLAYDQETFQLTMAAADGGEPRTITGHHLVIIKRQPDGTWKVVQSGSWAGVAAGMEGMHH